MQFDTITEILNIPNHKVVEIVQNTSNHLEVVFEPIEDVIPICSGCGRVHNTPVHSRVYIVIEDFPISGKSVFLNIRKRKVRCSEDGRIRVEEFGWIRKRFTGRFTDQVYRLTSIATNAEAGWYPGLDDEVVFR